MRVSATTLCCPSYIVLTTSSPQWRRWDAQNSLHCHCHLINKHSTTRFSLGPVNACYPLGSPIRRLLIGKPSSEVRCGEPLHFVDYYLPRSYLIYFLGLFYPFFSFCYQSFAMSYRGRPSKGCESCRSRKVKVSVYLACPGFYKILAL